jgi:hypothetical protein
LLFNPEQMAEDRLPVVDDKASARGRRLQLIFILQQFLQILNKTDYNYDGGTSHSDKE